MEGLLSSYWRDDFRPLKDAGDALLAALRDDESSPSADLYRRIRAPEDGSHHYFPARPLARAGTHGDSAARRSLTSIDMTYPPPASTATSTFDRYPTNTMDHDRSVPLPPYLARQLQSVKRASLMGLLPKAELAWLSVDHKLFIWPYGAKEIDGSFSFCSFIVPSEQCVLSVGLVYPRKDVFRPSVKWCLVVTTAEEAVLLALADSHGIAREKGEKRCEGIMYTFSHPSGALRLVPTRFSVSTDNVRMLCVSGTPDGRIFLGGGDGCLYEMSYENPYPRTGASGGAEVAAAAANVDEQLEQFYDGSLTPTTTIKGGYGWRSVRKRLLGTIGSKCCPRKCRKLNHSRQVPLTSKAFLPETLLRALAGFGGCPCLGGGSILKIVVDEERLCLYTLGAKGYISMFSFDTCCGIKVKLVSVMNAPEAAKIYLTAVSQGKMTAPLPNKRFVGNVAFAGGAPAAQMGVGGMDGARNILSHVPPDETNATHGVLLPVSLHVVPRKESDRITLIAVTRSGLRYYLSPLRRKLDSMYPSVDGLSLCHIRAPPPLEPTARVHDFAGNADFDDGLQVNGFVPMTSSTLSKVPLVDASSYDGNSMVLAVRSPRAGNVRLQDTPGDHIVALTPDFVFRKRDRETASVKDCVAGGVTESLWLPFCRVSSVDDAPLLPGGIVSDVIQASVSESSILKLVLNSQTPTDSELSVGLVPEFVPEKNIKTCVRGIAGDGACDLVGPVKSNLASAAIAVAWKVLPYVMMPRSLHRGIRFQKAVSRAPRRVMRKSRYRISQQHGTAGFSLSAGDVQTNKKRNALSRNSPRLNPWLLRPSVVPLNPLAYQHLIPSSRVVALNPGGLHYFNVSPILTAFKKAILSAGENIDSDVEVSSFFTSYGHAEGCAMCIVLALGLCDRGVNKNLADLAGRAVNTRAFSPKVSPVIQRGDVLVAESLSNVGESLFAVDPVLPKGYIFHPSALLEGVVKVTARIMRPVWHKPLVVVTEGRTLQLVWNSEQSTIQRTTPAKVELLLDNETHEQILRSVQSLARLMKLWFKDVIETVPGKFRSQSHLEIEGGTGMSLSIAEAFARQNYSSDGCRTGDGQLALPETERLATLIEERNIHSMFRLVTRTQQLLQLFSLLLKAHRASELPDVEWGSLHGLTVSQLVQSRDVHERLEKMLNDLVNSTAGTNASASPVASAEIDRLATEFADKCHLFFSPGARYAHLGFSASRRALRLSEGSSLRIQLTAQARKYFRDAARHWHGSSLVCGRSLRQREKEGFKEVAMAAHSGGSPVAMAAAVLTELGEVEAVVDICLTAAANFEVLKILTAERHGRPEGKPLAWENELYHRRKESHGVSSSALSSPPSRALTLGTNVTRDDARTACWFLIFYHLTTLLQQPKSCGNGARRMISRCSTESNRDFLHCFYSHLFETSSVDLLLQIKSPEVEEWIRLVVKDDDLLYKYYQTQSDFVRAGEMSLDRARRNTRKLPLYVRLKWLSNAVSAYSAAHRSRRRSWSTKRDMDCQLSEVRDLFDIAKLQLRTVQELSLSKMSVLEHEELHMSLMDATGLFHLAQAYGLNSICLLVMLSCKENNRVVLESLWRNVICEALFPCSTRIKALHEFLHNYQTNFSTDDLVVYLPESSIPPDETFLFEEGDWIGTLESKVISTGKEVFGKGADFMFPCQFMAKELEQLRDTVLSFVPSLSAKMRVGWSLRILVEVGVRFTDALNTVADLPLKEQERELLGRDDSQRADQLAGIVSVLKDWLACAHKEQDKGQELVQAFHAERLGDKLCTWKHEAECMGTLGLLESFDEIESQVHRLLDGGFVGNLVRG